MALHTKCRNGCYPRNDGQGVERFPVPDEKVSWSVEWPSYNPPEFTMKDMKTKPWADPETGTPDFNPKWNALDGKVNRISHMGEYSIVDECPRNSSGRTGLKGRGYLGRWGPNHAADPVVTRWKRMSNGSMISDNNSELPVLQFIAIQRHDCGEWAIPGGMVDPGELVTATLKREFCEEAMNSLSLTDQEKTALEESLSNFFKTGKEVYKGYVDDPRNTDNAWIETVVYNFHDDKGDVVGRFPLQAGDDAASVRWIDLSREIQLYASHSQLLKKVTAFLGAHW